MDQVLLDIGLNSKLRDTIDLSKIEKKNQNISTDPKMLRTTEQGGRFTSDTDSLTNQF